MGKIIYPIDEWEEDERDNERGHPRRLKKPSHIVDRDYIGFGHWLLNYSDGTSELIREPNNTFTDLFYKVGNYDDKGHPVYPK